MASDEDYSKFLGKANQDTGGASTRSKSKKLSTKSVDTKVPKELEGIEEYYVSEADEPFEPVSLKWDKDGLPSEGDCDQEPLLAVEVNDESSRYGQPDWQGGFEHIAEAV